MSRFEKTLFAFSFTMILLLGFGIGTFFAALAAKAAFDGLIIFMFVFAFASIACVTSGLAATLLLFDIKETYFE